MSEPLPALSPVRLSPSGVRMRTLCKTEAFEFALVYYPPGIVQHDHAHEEAQLSFLLSGGFAEESEGRNDIALGARHAFKPAGARHAVDFGWSGALTLHLEFRRGYAPKLATSGWEPSGLRERGLAALLARHVEAPELIADDLLASVSLGRKRTDRAVARRVGDLPGWLLRAAEQITDDPLAEIGDVAANARVHRVHLSRAFQKHLGLSPTQLRLEAKSSRALQLMLEEGASPGEAAAGAGFADQAHWSRASRVCHGLPPGRIRALLAA